MKEPVYYLLEIYKPKKFRLAFYLAAWKLHAEKKMNNRRVARISEKEKKRCVKYLERKGLRYKCYEEAYARSGNYRREFIHAYPGPWRCRYCHRRLKEEKMEVDHLMPVAKAQNSKWAQSVLKMQGIANVNDVKNLVPSCHRCNNRKRDKAGLWYVRGFLGRYKLYWLFYNLLRLAILLLILAGIYYIGCAGKNRENIIFFNSFFRQEEMSKPKEKSKPKDESQSKDKGEKDIPENTTNPEEQSRQDNIKQEKVDYSQYDFFSDISWTRETEADTEYIEFFSDGSFSYYCACGEPVNDSDLCEGYTYNDKTKTITLNCMEKTNSMVTTIVIKSCDENCLKLDFNGEVRKFVREE